MAKIIIPDGNNDKKQVRVDNVITDLNGTLIDGGPLFDKAASKVLTDTYGIKLLPDSIWGDFFKYIKENNIKGDVNKLFSEYVITRYALKDGKGQTVSAAKFGKQQDRELEKLFTTIGYQPGAGEFLRDFRQVGDQMALVTNSSPEQIEMLKANPVLNKVFPFSNFDKIITGDKAQGYETALGVLDPRGKRMAFEDDVKGIKPAIASRTKTEKELPICAVNVKPKDKEEVGKLADHMVKTHADIEIER